MMDRGRDYQRTPRFTKRLEVTFSSGGLSFKGILSNISVSGIFIRTNRGFAPGTTVDIEVVLPSNHLSNLKGIVRRSIKTPMTTMKNGMGIELTQQDKEYEDFLRTFLNEVDPENEQEIGKNNTIDAYTEMPPLPEFQIISCPHCHVKNKVSRDKLSRGPKCGRCGTPLPVSIP